MVMWGSLCIRMGYILGKGTRGRRDMTLCNNRVERGCGGSWTTD